MMNPNYDYLTYDYGHTVPLTYNGHTILPQVATFRLKLFSFLLFLLVLILF